MSSYILEGESFFVLKEMDRILKNKKFEINPEPIKSMSFLKTIDFSVYFDPNKEERINENFVVCFPDKNLDLRSQWVKELKNRGEFITYDPIPATDFASLSKIFPNIKNTQALPTKFCPLKYKGQKQSYEWFDLSLISDIYKLKDNSIYEEMFVSYFDIWKFTDQLWSLNPECLEQIRYINAESFEDYFNRIRETSKDYLEIIQTQANNFYQHKNQLPNSTITNEFRFNKIKENLNHIQKEQQLICVSFFDNCLKNVRLGSNPKLELVDLFFRLKRYGK